MKKLFVWIFLAGIFCITQIHAKERTSPEVLLKSLKGKKHPYLLFKDIKETPGWKYREEQPYKSWNNSIRSGRMVDRFLSYPFKISGYYPNGSYGGLLINIAFHYQVTGKEKYAKKVVEVLKSLKKFNWNGLARGVARDLLGFLIAYDWVHPYLVKNYPSKVDKEIREYLAKGCNTLYAQWPNSFNVLERIEPGYAIGIGALTFPDHPDAPKWLTAATDWCFEKSPYKKQHYRPAILEWPYLNEGGLPCAQGYLNYFMRNTMVFLHAWNYNFKENIISRYPLLRRCLNSVLWECLPDGRSPAYNTDHNWFFGGFWHVFQCFTAMPEPDRKYFAWYVNKFLLKPLDPEWDDWRDPKSMIWDYIFYDKHTAFKDMEEPPFNTFISPRAEVAIFRKDRSITSDYLFFRAFHTPDATNRWMTHNDNMSIDYYSHGTILIADSGEIKNYLCRPDRLGRGGYGGSDSKGHNIVMINDGSGPVGGAVKGFGSFTHFDNPAYLKDFLITDFFEYAEGAIEKWEKIEDRSPEPHPSNGWYWGHDYYKIIKLKDPVSWYRCILYPHKDYFVVLDGITGKIKRKIDTLFHLGSFTITKGKGRGKNYVPGYVHGELMVGNKRVDWLSQKFGKEVSYGKGNLIRWKTTCKYDKKNVEMYLYSLPDSEITVEKFWTRIDGYHRREVDNPLVRFKLKNVRNMRRITVLYTIYPDKEEKPVFEDISGVKFTGVKLKTKKWIDYICYGEEISVKNNFSTDGSYVYLRTDIDGNLKSLFVRNGSGLVYRDRIYIKAEDKIPHIAVNFRENLISGHINSDKEIVLKIRGKLKGEVIYKPEPSDWLWEWELTPELKKKYKERKISPEYRDGYILIKFPKGRGKFILQSK
ncbi:MAG TPA: hypothetical protein ENG68_02225 [bacterium]|nr:hypothetical protein [bacterium]